MATGDESPSVTRHSTEPHDATERRRTEVEVRESEERLKTLFESAPDAYYLNDLEGYFVDGNTTAEEISGYKREELIGQSFLSLKLLSPEEMSKAAALLARNSRGESTGPDEFTLNRKDGTRVPLEIRTFPVTIRGRPLVLAIARDIGERKRAEETLRNAYDDLELRVQERTADLQRELSERKRAEEATRESEERYRSLYVRTPVALHSIDADGRLVEVSDHWLELFGYERNEVIGRKSVDFLTEQSRRYAETVTLPEFMKTGDARDVSYQFVKKNGEIVDMLLDAITVRDEEGNYVRSLAVLADVTERKRAEQAIQESEERFHRLSNAAFEGITVAENGRILDANEQFAKMHGYELPEVIGMYVLDLVAPESRDLAAQNIKSQYDKPYEALNLRKDGSILPVEVCGKPVPYHGRIARVTVIRDISDRKRAEEALQVAREELEGKVEHQLLRRNPYRLTFRELTVLHLVAAGKSDKEIGFELAISPLTAQKHVSNILAKMGAASRTEAVARALREGMLD